MNKKSLKNGIFFQKNVASTLAINENYFFVKVLKIRSQILDPKKAIS